MMLPSQILHLALLLTTVDLLMSSPFMIVSQHTTPPNTTCPSSPPPHHHCTCSTADLQALHSIVVTFPATLMASWHRHATTLHSCCGSWPPLTITCTSASPPTTAIAPRPCDAVKGKPADNRIVGLEIRLLRGDPFYQDTKPVDIPVALCSLSALTSLRLIGGFLSGPIPDCITTNLTSLSELDLSSNQLSGRIPSRLTFPHLTRLDLSYNSLSGSLPSFHTPKLFQLDLRGNSLSGTLSPLLYDASHLSSLDSLDLSENHLDGALDTFRRSLNLAANKSLSSLYLSGNRFNGRFPAALLCDGVNDLDISYNELSGNLHHSTLPDDCNFTALTFLDMSFNRLSGALPEWLGAFPNLSELYMINSTLHGSIIPNGWKGLTSLSGLYLSGTLLLKPNRSAPKLPCWLFSLAKLRVLDLSSTGLHDSDMVDVINSCSDTVQQQRISMQLTSLHLSGNSFTAALLPNFIAKIQVFQPDNPGELLLSGNPLEMDLSDPTVVELIPTPLHSLDLGSCKLRGHLTRLFFNRFSPFLFDLRLDHNQLDGEIPPELGDMLNLGSLDLSYNQFSGLSRLTRSGLIQVYDLNLSNNNLTGDLTSLLYKIAPNVSSCGTSSIVTLDLSQNWLTGVIPAFLCQCVLTTNDEVAYFLTLRLHHNRLVGSLSQIGPLMSPRVQVLMLSNNQLTGQIPPSLRNVTALMLLDLSYNHLGGDLDQFFSIASSSKQYSALRVLMLGNNLFTGNIPTGLGKVAPTLQLIDLSSNHLTGFIPVLSILSIPALKAKYYPPHLMTYSHLQHETSTTDVAETLNEQIQIILKGNEQKFSYIRWGLTFLDFSSNKLNGSIRRGLGDLSALVYLNLSKNYLSGPIPSDLGKLEQLESLDLSFNMLEGSIPSSLGGLTKLEVFNVSYNPELSGQIIMNNPQMERNDSYLGDPKLCGPPILRNCTPPSNHGSDNPSKKSLLQSFVDEWVSIPGLFIGIVGGFIGCVWLFNAC